MPPHGSLNTKTHGKMLRSRGKAVKMTRSTTDLVGFLHDGCQGPNMRLKLVVRDLGFRGFLHAGELRMVVVPGVVRNGRMARGNVVGPHSVLL